MTISNTSAIDAGLRALGEQAGAGDASKIETAMYLFDNAEAYAGEGGAKRAFTVHAEGKNSRDPFNPAIDLSNDNGVNAGSSKFGVFIKLGATHVEARRQIFGWTFAAVKSFPEGQRPSMYETLLAVARKQNKAGDVTLTRTEVDDIVCGKRKPSEEEKAAAKAEKAAQAEEASATGPDTSTRALTTPQDYADAFRILKAQFAEKFPERAKGEAWEALAKSIVGFALEVDAADAMAAQEASKAA